MSWIPRFRVSQLLWSVVVVSSVLAVVLVYGRIGLLNAKVERLTAEVEAWRDPKFPRYTFAATNDLVAQRDEVQAWLESLEGSTWEARSGKGKPLRLEFGRQRIITEPTLSSETVRRQTERAGGRLITYNCTVSYEGYGPGFSFVVAADRRLGIYNKVQFRGGDFDPELGHGAAIDDDLLYIHLALPSPSYSPVPPYGIEVDTVFKRIETDEHHDF